MYLRQHGSGVQLSPEWLITQSRWFGLQVDPPESRDKGLQLRQSQRTELKRKIDNQTSHLTLPLHVRNCRFDLSGRGERNLWYIPVLRDGHRGERVAEKKRFCWLADIGNCEGRWLYVCMYEVCMYVCNVGTRSGVVQEF
jgi:hypothetical protein